MKRKEANFVSKARILGTGFYVPERVMTNHDFEKIVDTSDEWILSHTGVRERRIARLDEYTSDMGICAAKRALEDAAISIDKIDCILFATLTPDYIFPSTACLLQCALGAREVPSMDIQAACSGYLYALFLAKAFIESGQGKNVLVVAAEKLSSIINYKDRSTCVLFGDGASACVVGIEGKGLVIEGISLGSDGSQAGLLMLPGGGCRNPATKESIEKELHFLQMSGNAVFKHAVRRMEAIVKECLEKTKMTEEDIHWLIPHQANERIIDAIARRLERLPADRVYKKGIAHYGNTSASTIGIALDELRKEKKVKEGENILLTAFGAGFTWGAAILKN